MVPVVALGWYEVSKFFHVVLAIVAVGFNATYGVWLARAAREPEHERFTLRGVKLLDDRFANPAYALLLVTGLLMIWVGDLDLAQFWIIAALILYAVAVGLGLFAYTPTLRRQIAVLETSGPSSAEFRSLSDRGRTLGSGARGRRHRDRLPDGHQADALTARLDAGPRHPRASDRWSLTMRPFPRSRGRRSARSASGSPAG